MPQNHSHFRQVAIYGPRSRLCAHRVDWRHNAYAGRPSSILSISSGNSIARAFFHPLVIFCNGQLCKCRFKIAKAASAKLLKDSFDRDIGKRRVNPDQILRLCTPPDPLDLTEAIRIGFGLPDFLLDPSTSSVRLIREYSACLICSFWQTVTQLITRVANPKICGLGNGKKSTP